MIYFLLLIMCGFIGMIILAALSPIGYEDENGFHYGIPNEGGEGDEYGHH